MSDEPTARLSSPRDVESRLRLGRWLEHVRELPRKRQVALLAVVAVAEFLFPWHVFGRILALLAGSCLTGSFLWDSLRLMRRSAGLRSLLRTRFIELALTVAALSLLASMVHVWMASHQPDADPKLESVYSQYLALFFVAAGLRFVAGEFPIRRVLHRLDFSPAQTVTIGFAGMILIGALLLTVPPAVGRLETVSVLDALFTATSAVTVTGLGVYDIGTFHTAWGQWVILLLIQVGGLGTMATSASLAVLAGRRLRLRAAASLQESMDLQTVGQVAGQLRTVIRVTVAAEGLGALLLYWRWIGSEEVGKPAFAAVFHAVSAFCNAGFSTLTLNLVPFQTDWLTNAVIGALIVLGGLGFPLFHHFASVVRSWRRVAGGPIISLHARLALMTTGVLLVGGTVAFLAFEWNESLAGNSGPDRLLVAGFLSVTARTAGFNTVDVGLLRPATLWALMLLMFIGGCPGSTAGGIKTTTAAAMVATLLAILRGNERVQAFRRTVPAEQVSKALALVGASLVVVSAGILGLLLLEPGDPLVLMFEAVSAFGTVGLSAGATARLGTIGKLLIAGLMFVGRLGPLTLAFAMAARQHAHRVRYPDEKIMIG